MPEPEAVLICGLSGRALAQSARAAGFRPIVLDAFADLDTREAALRWRRVPVRPDWRWRRGPLLAAAERLAPAPIPLVWASGFERAPELLAELARGRPLWGTPPAVIRALKNPLAFARAARHLGLVHPTTRTTPPSDATGWLCKRRGAAGGGHVRWATATRPEGRGWYWQRHAPGRPVSALVAGTGAAAVVLGFSEQWPVPGRHFRFAGAAVPARCPDLARTRLGEAAMALARHYGIRGLASVDALVDGDQVTVLEVNPRPGASLDAYEQACGTSLFGLHREACAGRLPTAPATRAAAGSAIVMAPKAVRVPQGFAWPSWTADRTPGGAFIRGGAPVCTVLAKAGDIAMVRERLLEREALILGLLEPTRELGAGHVAPRPERNADDDAADHARPLA